MNGLREMVREVVREELALYQDRWLDVAGAADYLRCSVSRIYKLTSLGDIPFHKQGSRVVFRKSELDEWVDNAEKA